MKRTTAWVIVSFVCLLVSPADGQAPPSIVWEDGRLSVTAENAVLGELLQVIARLTGIDVRGAEGLHQQVSVQFSELSLDDALQRLLARVNHLLVEDASPDGGQPSLIVWVLGGGSPPPARPAVERTPPPQPPDDQTAGPLSAVLVDPEPGMRRWAIRRIGERHDESSLARLLGALSDEDAGVRQEVLEALAQYGTRAIAPAKELLSAEKDSDVRAAAILLLGQVGREGMAGFLRGMLADEDAKVRRAVVEALGHASERTATEALWEAIRDEDASVRMAALRTLASYVGEGAARDAIDRGLVARHEAIEILGVDLVQGVSSRAPAGAPVAAPGGAP